MMTRYEFEARIGPLAERFACALLCGPQSEYLTGKPERLAAMSVLMAYQYLQATEEQIGRVYRMLLANGVVEDPSALLEPASSGPV